MFVHEIQIFDPFLLQTFHHLVRVNILELYAVGIAEMHKCVGELIEKLRVFAPEVMRIEVDIFSDNHDEGEEDVDELHMFEVNLLYVEELVLIYIVQLLQLLFQFGPGYSAIGLWTKHLLDNCYDVLRDVRKWLINYIVLFTLEEVFDSLSLD